MFRQAGPKDQLKRFLELIFEGSRE
jgi:hypothetical protein